ncbi:hypothetical protein PR048_008771 [Dryococelus australis]|uniref:Uncharacterized protein n=1 Tax=Dryococelus australis TaxID=614101 RepID=A0ABQ9HY15_9NEOP|nr:hypothetical protein PR048_008771 [Dryococelus australis]
MKDISREEEALKPERCPVTSCRPPVAQSVGALPVWGAGGSGFESLLRPGGVLGPLYHPYGCSNCISLRAEEVSLTRPQRTYSPEVRTPCTSRRTIEDSRRKRPLYILISGRLFPDELDSRPITGCLPPEQLRWSANPGESVFSALASQDFRPSMGNSLHRQHWPATSANQEEDRLQLARESSQSGLDSSILGILESQLCVHWLLPHTWQLWDSQCVSLQSNPEPPATQIGGAPTDCAMGGRQVSRDYPSPANMSCRSQPIRKPVAIQSLVQPQRKSGYTQISNASPLRTFTDSIYFIFDFPKNYKCHHWLENVNPVVSAPVSIRCDPRPDNSFVVLNRGVAKCDPGTHITWHHRLYVQGTELACSRYVGSSPLEILSGYPDIFIENADSCLVQHKSSERVSEEIWVALNIEVLRADEGEASGAGMKKRVKQEIPEKPRRPAASSDTIHTYENPRVTPPGIKPGSPRRNTRAARCHPSGSLERLPCVTSGREQTAFQSFGYRLFMVKLLDVHIGELGAIAGEATPGFCTLELRGTMPLVSSFLGDLTFPPLVQSDAAPFPARFTLISYQG